MTDGVKKIICYVLFALQLVAAASGARGDILCESPASGHSRIETIAEQITCHSGQSRDDSQLQDESGATLRAQTCVDTPIVSGSVTNDSQKMRAVSELSHHLTVLPAFLFNPEVSQSVSALRAEVSDTLPNDTQITLRTVVLVI